MKTSRKWLLVRQSLMLAERIFMFVGGIFIGTGDIKGALILMALTAITHFIEHEVHYRCFQNLIGEEIIEHN